MDLSILEKLSLIGKFFVSSFLGIELFLFILIFFLFLILNMKKKNSLVKILTIFLPIGILLFISGGFHDYVISSIDYFITKLMSYYYFPSMGLYYVFMLLITGFFIYTILSEKIKKEKKIVNYSFFSCLYLLFVGLSGYVISNEIILTIDSSIYQNNVILSFVQVSNILILIWIIVTLFYHLYFYLKRRFDH